MKKHSEIAGACRKWGGVVPDISTDCNVYILVLSFLLHG
jgi:hypothetical protein